MATLAWVDVTQKRAYVLSLEQTPTAPHPDTEQTRSDTSVTHSAHVVTTPHLQPLTSRVVDGYGGQTTFIDGICALPWYVVGKLRRDAHRRHLSRGPRHSGPGRPKPDDGQVDITDLARFEPVDAEDADMALYAHVVNHPP
jgi:hypothetical protein